MRIILTALFCIFAQYSFSQKISYTIPSGYEQSISKENYKKMVDMSVKRLATRFTVEEVSDGAIKVNGGAVFNLHNLILQCAKLKSQSDFDIAIEGHFDNVFASMDAKNTIDVEKYESIKDMLALRIYPDATVKQYGGADNLVNRTDLEGTKTILMLDLPGSFSPVAKDLFTKWKKDSAEVFGIAQLNINKHQVDTFTKQFKFENNFSLPFHFIVEDDYASSYALDLAKNCPLFVGTWGAVVSIPNKAMAAICKVGKDNPVDFVKFIERTKDLMERQYAGHPQPVSPDYFWYYKGQFTKIKVLEENGKLNVISPLGLGLLMTEQ